MSKASNRASQVLALHAITERMFTEAGDNATALRIHSEVKRLSKAAEALDNMRINRNPLDTSEAHTKRIGEAAQKFSKATTDAINRMGAALREGKADVQRRIGEKVKLTPNPEYARELRDRYFAMNPDQQRVFVEKLINNNRGPELAALVKAPIELTGMSEDERAAYEQCIIERHAGAELRELEGIDAAFHDAMIVTRTSGEFAKSLNDPEELARIETGEKASNAAGASFEQALSPE